MNTKTFAQAEGGAKVGISFAKKGGRKLVRQNFIQNPTFVLFTKVEGHAQRLISHLTSFITLILQFLVFP
jgi:hypothetical protein